MWASQEYWDLHIRKGVLANQHLAQLGEAHGLHECIILNSGTIAPSAKMITTAVEAILGAVHKDGGEASLAGVMDRLGLTPHVLSSPVTSLLPSLVFCYAEWPRRYSSGLLGPFAVALCSRVAQPPERLSGFEGQLARISSPLHENRVWVS